MLRTRRSDALSSKVWVNFVPTNDVVKLAIATDRNMLDAAIVVLTSALERCTKSVQVHFLAYQLDASEQEKVRSICARHAAELIIHDLGEHLFVGAEQKDSKITLVTLARMYLPQWVTGKILYLDCDMLVCDDIAEVFQTDMKGALLGVVRDPIVLSRVAKGRALDDPSLAYFKSIMEPAPLTDYFNAGMLLMDCDRIGADDILMRDMTDVTKANAYKLLDQDHLNVLFSGKTFFLPLRWNDVWAERRKLSKHLGRIDFLNANEMHRVDEPAVIHFTGPWKPWHRLKLDMIVRRRLPVILRYRKAAHKALKAAT